MHGAVVALSLGHAILLGDWRLNFIWHAAPTHLPSIRRGVRRAHARTNIWRGAPGLSRQRATLGTVAHPGASRMKLTSLVHSRHRRRASPRRKPEPSSR